MSQYIILLVGESGSGKTTVADLLESQYGLKVLKSYTTRPKRHPDDTDHTYISFEDAFRLQEVIAETNYNGNYYCATRAQVDDCDVYVIDPVGVDSFENRYHGEKEPLVFFLDANPHTRRRRMELRGDKEEYIAKRLKNDKKAFAKFRKQVYSGDDYIPLTVDDETPDDIARTIFGVYNCMIAADFEEALNENFV